LSKKQIGALFVITSSALAFRFISSWEQLISLVLLWSLATLIHIRAVSYLPTIRFSLAMIAVVPLVSLHGLGWALFSALTISVFETVIFGQHWRAFLRNSLNYGTSMLTAGLVFSQLGGTVNILPVPESLLPLIASGLSYSLVNILIASIFLMHNERRGLRSAFATIASASWLNYLAVTYAGTVLAVFNYALGLTGLVMFGGLLLAIIELLQVNTKMHHERNQRLQMQAELRVDPKTGVFNFRQLHDWLSKDEAEPASLLFIDIDDFKHLNDRHGHEVGDEALRTVAMTIKNSVRETDSVIRFGGEEFVVIIPGIDAQEACTIAERVRSEIARETSSQAHLALTVSIGVASLAGANDKHDLLMLADRAMYRAKGLGKNRCCLWTGKAEANAAVAPPVR